MGKQSRRRALASDCLGSILASAISGCVTYGKLPNSRLVSSAWSTKGPNWAYGLDFYFAEKTEVNRHESLLFPILKLKKQIFLGSYVLLEVVLLED